MKGQTMHFTVEHEPARTSDFGSVLTPACWVIFRVFTDGSRERFQSFTTQDEADRNAAFRNR